MSQQDKPKEWWIFKGTSNFCSELVLSDDCETMVKAKPEGFYDVVSDKDTVAGAIHVIEKSHADKLESALKVATEALATPEMDCGYNSCKYVFPENRCGMRTNGGCRCIDGKGRLILERHLHNQRQAIERIKEILK